MFGLRYIKSRPTEHLMQFRKGQLVREGVGLSFHYFGPTSILVSVPTASQAAPFMLDGVTSDFQSVTAQGELAYRVKDARRLAQMLDFSLKPDGKGHASEDPARLRERVLLIAEAKVQQVIQTLPLHVAITANDQVAEQARIQMEADSAILALGLEIIGFTIVALRPSPDLARAMEARIREQNMKAADDAVYERRMASVENERSIRQNELDTQIAVEQKQREIQEAQLDAKRAVLTRQNELRRTQLDADVALENERKTLVAHQAQNTRMLAEAEAHRVKAVMLALQDTDPKVVQALAATGMKAEQLIAQAFGGLAERAGQIGQLNISPELLGSLISAPAVTATRTGKSS